MNVTLKMEEVALSALSIVVLVRCLCMVVVSVLILVPDVFMLGYLINPRIGAFSYNLGHHRTGAWGLWFGFLTGSAVLMLAGVILFGHAALIESGVMG